MQAAAALGPAGVWAFGVIDPRLNLVVPYSARYHGRAGWVRLPAGLLTVSALSGEDVWAIGPTVNTAARGLGDLGGTLPTSAGLTVFARGETSAVGRPVT